MDTLDIDQYQDAPVVPSYQEALLRAVEVDPELASAFSEMRCARRPSAPEQFRHELRYSDDICSL